MSKVPSPFLVVFIFIVTLLLYYPVFSVYFSHDDFFHFKASLTNGTLSEFVKLFGFPPYDERGYAFYRPIFRESLYNLYYNLFGLSSTPLRVFSFGIHFLNIFLVYHFIQKLLNSKKVSFFVALTFGATAANVGSLYYLAGGLQTLGATFFILLTLIIFLNGKVFLSLFPFLLALGSHEIASITPFLLGGLIFLKTPVGNLPRVVLKTLWPFFLILGVYLYFDVFKIGFLQQDAQYETIFSLSKILNSLAWYSLWSLGIPEMFIDFIGPGVNVNPNLMKFWAHYVVPILFFSLTLVMTTLVSIFLARREIVKDKKLFFFLFWFPLALSPVIFLPLHKSTYYLTPALPAFWAVVTIVLFKALQVLGAKGRFALLSVFTLSFVSLTFASVRLANITYPAANRGRIAEKLLLDTKRTYPNLPRGAVVYYENDPGYPFISTDWGGSSKQASFALNNQDGVQLLYKDFTLRVYYEDMGGLPKDIDFDKVYSLTAKID